MEFPGGIPNFRGPPGSQDPQGMPPPPPNFPSHRLMHGGEQNAGSQGSGSGHMHPNSQVPPNRMPPGYPPMGEHPHLNSAGYPVVGGQEQSVNMNFPGPGQQMQQQQQQHSIMPGGYNPQMAPPMNSRPPQNMSNFHHNSTMGSAGVPPQSYAAHIQQRPPPPAAASHPPPPAASQQQHSLQNPYQNPQPPRQQHLNDFNSQQQPQQSQHNVMSNDFRHHQGTLPTSAPEFIPQQQHHHQQQHSIVADYVPGHHLQRSVGQQNYHPQSHDQGMSHDFRMRNHNDGVMGGGGYMDHHHHGAMGMHGMMGDHGMMRQMDGGHLMGAGDGYSQHGMMHMYRDPNMPEMQEGDYMLLGCELMDKAMNAGVACVNFDHQQELLWAGSQRGYISSYYGSHFQKYSACRVHMEESVRQNLTFPQGVLSLTPSLLRGTLRRGLPVFTFKDPKLHDMQCMMMKGSESVLIGGPHNEVIEVDIIQNCLSNVFEVKDAGVAIFRHNERFICGGDSTGKVTVYDSKTMRAEHTLEAHASCLSDFDIHDNLLITCGFSSRMNSLTPDRLLMVYDMRVMRAMSPIQVAINPTFLRFLPTIPNHIIVVSSMGSFQLVETIISGAPPSTMTYPVETNGNIIMAFDVSKSEQALAFGDSGGHVHLYGTNPQCMFNPYSEPSEFADPIDQHAPIEINDELSAYSAIQMQYPPQGPLVSDFPENMMARAYRKPLPIDSEILKTMKVYQNVGYAPNLKKQNRNVCPYDMGDKTSDSRKAMEPESPMGRGDDPFATVPKRYRRVEIKYSKLGVEDFDFRHYNKTNLAGLEPHIPNAYCNSMLQVLYYMEPLRCALLGHVCAREFCLSCELGFLFHMLDSQKGKTCQATNFLRAFRTMPQVSALGLILHDIDENSGKVQFPRLIQSWQRFVLMQIHDETCVPVESDNSEKALAIEKKGDKEKGEDESKDGSKKGKKKGNKKKKKNEAKNQENQNGGTEGSDDCDEEDDPEVTMTRSIIRDLLGIQTKSTLQCKCGVTSERDVDGTHINLMYPECQPDDLGRNPIISFGEVVQHSMTASTNMQAWCAQCNRYQHHCQRKSVQNLPDVLALNCHTEMEKNLNFWKTQFQIVRERHQETQSTMAYMKPTSQSAIKCRFGLACHRPDCRFQHDGPRECDNQAPKRVVEDEDFGPSWIPMGLKVTRKPEGGVEVEEISDEEPLPSHENDDVRYYELYSVVSHVLDHSGGNLVSCLKVGEKFHQRKERVTCTQWYLINDFCITPVEKDEAVDFKLNWNVPCIIHYSRRNYVSYHDLTVKNWHSSDILYNDTALLNPERRKVEFVPLSSENLPQKGDIVALDAEFVSLKEEEAELRSDGTRSTIIPSQNAAARITCIRGSEPNQGEPFIDDYISTQEQVVDYLTQYSGIKPGDLDPNLSNKHLTTLKSTYLKLRYMVDNGVIFVGHGLKKDFRVINLLVPKPQVMDTVELYHLPKQRFISLKFLAWYFLKINIQSYTHDSAEDARTALQLYLYYKKLKDEDPEKMLATIKELYEEGRKLSWKIPDVIGEEVGEGEADIL